MTPDDVKEWQRVIGAKPDGNFGPKSRAASEEFLNKVIPMKTSGKAALVGGVIAAIGGLFAAISLTSDKRAKVVRIARGELGPADPDKYWAVVQPKLMGNPTGISWCGGFALWALQQAGLAKDMIWHIWKGEGSHSGFAETYKLPRTKDPKPGDIAYFDQPFQHHAIVERNNGDGTVDTIDGNQKPGESVGEKKRVPIKSATAFYSIENLV